MDVARKPRKKSTFNYGNDFVLDFSKFLRLGLFFARFEKCKKNDVMYSVYQSRSGLIRFSSFFSFEVLKLTKTNYECVL